MCVNSLYLTNKTDDYVPQTGLKSVIPVIVSNNHWTDAELVNKLLTLCWIPSDSSQNLMVVCMLEVRVFFPSTHKTRVRILTVGAFSSMWRLLKQLWQTSFSICVDSFSVFLGHTPHDSTSAWNMKMLLYYCIIRLLSLHWQLHSRLVLPLTFSR